LTGFFPNLSTPPTTLALRFGEQSLTYEELARVVGGLATQLVDAVGPDERVAVLAEERIETAVAVVAALVTGRCATPCNPRGGSLELRHQIDNARPARLLAAPDASVPDALADVPRLDVSLAGGEPFAAPAPDAGSPALVMYTSGTTGLPKGAVLSHAALTWDLDALATAWAWTSDDTLVHALPLYHVHGLVLGVLGPLRVGATLHHVGRFDPDAVGAALDRGGTMLFGVPTMYQRLADAAEADDGLARSLGRARLLVSGSAGLPLTVHERIRSLTGSTIVERYGMTETCITCAVPAAAPRPGTVGPPLPGVELRLVDDDGHEVVEPDAMGEIHVRTPSVFAGYLGDPAATAEVVGADGWLRSGDLATRDEAGYLRIVGRRSVDLIKCGGYKISAGEIESALLAHPAVAEAAVKALPDDDLGEIVAAWVVLRPGATVGDEALVDHVTALLSAHKRARALFVVDRLPRNAMGKVTKAALEPRP
jgi:malonyl-CoA/methylmalonyl-CoA synthetase